MTNYILINIINKISIEEEKIAELINAYSAILSDKYISCRELVIVKLMSYHRNRLKTFRQLQKLYKDQENG